MGPGNQQNRISMQCSTSLCTRFIVGLWLMLSLSGCQRQPETLLDDYHARLQRVLGVQLQPREDPFVKSELPGLPEVRAISLATQPATIDLTDMLALDVCDLETLIAQRNSSLGKVQTDAALLHYELDFHVKLERCLTTPALANQLAPELKQKLQQIQRQKQQDLPAHFANLLSRDQTLRQQLSGSQRGISAEQGGLAETVQALKQLNLLKSHLDKKDYAAARDIPINSVLGVLYRTQLIADLQHSLRLSEQFFYALAEPLALIPAAKLCHADSEIRENLLQQIFIGRVQKELARVDGIAAELIPALMQLYQQHPLQQSVIQRLQEPQLRLQQHLRQHVAFWQRWRQCDSVS